MNQLVAQLTHPAFPAVAAALRARLEEIMQMWDVCVRSALPQMDRLTLEELRDGNPKILDAIAHALGSSDPEEIKVLVERAPVQGLTRFHLHYDVVDVMQEDRLLRAVVVVKIEEELGRQLMVCEASALHAAIDVMLQRAVVAIVNEQKAELRAAAERELKYLSYLSHDLNNNLGGISLNLLVLGRELAEHAQFAEAAAMLATADRSIHETVDGMRRLLEHEKLRKGAQESDVKTVDLQPFVTGLCSPFCREAEQRGLQLVIETEPCKHVRTDPELVSLVLRNLMGNALKYASRGVVRISCRAGADGRSVISVADEGPGIAAEHLSAIFDAFRRGEAHGREGVGLGLAIASQAAKLLGAELTVASELGSGSTFRLTLPVGTPL